MVWWGRGVGGGGGKEGISFLETPLRRVKSQGPRTVTFTEEEKKKRSHPGVGRYEPSSRKRSKWCLAFGEGELGVRRGGGTRKKKHKKDKKKNQLGKKVGFL